MRATSNIIPAAVALIPKIICIEEELEHHHHLENQVRRTIPQAITDFFGHRHLFESVFYGTNIIF